MSITGIIAEFDPFHLGHAYLLRQARALDPQGTILIALSGHFTQRGAPAAFSPTARAEMALACGADLVLELPLPWAISSAESFALGGVELLAAAGADHLVFGSESGALSDLWDIAHCLASEDFRLSLRRSLADGSSFAAARQAAVAALLGESISQCLSQPNDLLGVSYLSAILRLGAHLEAHAVPRVGPPHAAAQEAGGFASASAIRALLQRADGKAAASRLPAAARPILLREWEAGLAPASLINAQRAILYQLRTMTPDDFRALPDCSEGLEHRLARAAQQATSLEEFYTLAKTKRYPHSRIRRLGLWAFLKLRAQDRPDHLPYLRVLGFNERGQAHLRHLKQRAALPILIKPAAVRRLDASAQQLFSQEARAADLWRLCLPNLRNSAGGSIWTTGPVIFPREKNPTE